jgi:Inner membrane protein YgaP-like, transmembrane domain
MSRLNVGNIDRVLRILVGLALIGLAATGTIGIWGYIGVIPLVTGLAARCPLYAVLGIATTAR